jgi:hypothetical protein
MALANVDFVNKRIAAVAILEDMSILQLGTHRSENIRLVHCSHV